MEVILITAILSLLLAGLFVVFFLYTRDFSEGRSLEQDSLLPFGEEEAIRPGVRTVNESSDHGSHATN